MNEAINNILTRRSIRQFYDKPIAKSDLELIINAALHAPSGLNRQLWQFSVLGNKELMKSLACAVGKALKREDYDFYMPNVLIIVSNDRDNAHAMADTACALENIFLSANSLGIGSVWINQLSGISDNPEIRRLLSEIGVPENHLVYGCAALGYAACEPAKREMKCDVVRWVL